MSIKNIKPVKIGVIGGSGLYEIEELVIEDEVSVDTPFGEPSDKFLIGYAWRNKGRVFTETRKRAPHSAHSHKLQSQYLGNENAGSRANYSLRRMRQLQR